MIPTDTFLMEYVHSASVFSQLMDLNASTHFVATVHFHIPQTCVVSIAIPHFLLLILCIFHVSTYLMRCVYITLIPHSLTGAVQRVAQSRRTKDCGTVENLLRSRVPIGQP